MKRSKKSSKTKAPDEPTFVNLADVGSEDEYADTSKGKGKGKSKDPPVMKLSYGKVANAGRPEGYSASTNLELSEVPAEKLDHATNMILMTSVPIKNRDDTRADHSDGISEIFVDSDTKKKLYAMEGFPKPLRQPSKKAHRIGPTLSSGLGMIATRKIKAGNLILSERPLLVVPQNISAMCRAKLPENYTLEQKKQVVLFEAERVAQTQVSRMFEEDRRALLALCNSHQQDGSGPVIGRVRTNGLGLPEELTFMGLKGAGAGYTSIGDHMSRLNHSCSPNASRRFDIPTFSWILHAVRDIQEGEEIFTQYCELLSPTVDRQAYLLPYGIDPCDCDSCNDPESDARRAKIIAQPAIFMNADYLKGKKGGLAQKEADILEQLRLIEREGLQAWFCYSKNLKALAMIYSMMGNTEKMQETVKKAQLVARYQPGLEALMLFGGT